MKPAYWQFLASILPVKLKNGAVSGVLVWGLIRLLYPSERRRSARAAGLSGYGIYHVIGYVVMQAQQRSANRAGVTGLIMSPKEHNTYANGARHGNEIPYVFDTLTRAEPTCHYVNENDSAFCLAGGGLLGEFRRHASSRTRDVLHGSGSLPASIWGEIVCCGLAEQTCRF